MTREQEAARELTEYIWTAIYDWHKNRPEVDPHMDLACLSSVQLLIINTFDDPSARANMMLLSTELLSEGCNLTSEQIERGKMELALMRASDHEPGSA